MKKLILFLFLIALVVVWQKGVFKKPDPLPNPTTDTSLSEAEIMMKEKENLIRITTPRPNDIITSPLTIEGEARGYWFFEASFPVVLTDADGLIIAEWYATADGEWMTEDFVPFKAVIEFQNPNSPIGKRGALILQKDNPSGLPENDDALEIPIMFE